ncbi:alpha/beta hydrolase [Paenibacillus mucilaginosus]|uniref:Carboxylesterase n=2 Tax=Paenibacillus mucilaginosus TaxID=61624 RepID=I0BAD0_9BACL|nr:alpha/beta fold hydrolase [Paenibacillus mucilaginosus]AEI38866.1 carboxylesterase [Paenibacillus mucilaginosus KNP414]AFH59327.1 carboxylesterase [Paenibacillus mucilaginosus K02]MCG7217309.1 alpha/beta fold hydrolase [Paenibacillus mucilaginosus]WDM27933.1 alpha/beta fold hydrolase [Paenibacillus mucilaginosus]
MTRQYRTTEPFHLEGTGERASTELLLIHGFTGSPSEFRRLGYYLNDLGYTVRGILLPGHGTTPEDMIRTGLNDWSRHVTESFDTIRAQGGPDRRIVAVGHSMGGLLALKLAMERPLAGVVSLAAPIFLASRKTVLAVLLQYFVKYVERRPTVPPHIIEEACSYSRTPIPCVVDLRKLLKHVKTSLNEVKAPLFIGQGGRDKLVLPRSAEYIYRHVSSAFRQMAHYPSTSHAILLDEERERVYADIHRFLVTLEHIGTWEQTAAGYAP